jgi:hypothetical protein
MFLLMRGRSLAFTGNRLDNLGESGPTGQGDMFAPSILNEIVAP